MTLKDEPHRSAGVQYVNGEEWRNSSRRNEEAKPRRKLYLADVSSGKSRVRCCKEHYCIGTWNVRSTNQVILEVVKQEIARLNMGLQRVAHD